MARLYNAGQYNQEFQPKRLGNWEVAKWFPERKLRDPLSFKPTEPIVDDRGHFLPGAPRANRNPWNNHIGTHDQPPRITRAIANELASRPAARLRYWDKPNPRLRPVPCPAKDFRGAPGYSLVAEGPGFPQHRNYFLNKQDYVEHADRIDEQDVVAVDFLKERRRRQDAVKERVEQVKELTAALRQQQEERRRQEADRDVQWLLEHREQHNIVPREHDWSRGAPRPTLGCERDFAVQRPARRPRRRKERQADDSVPVLTSSSGRLLSVRSSVSCLF